MIWDNLQELGDRLVACYWWRWMPGMLAIYGDRVLKVDGDVLTTDEIADHRDAWIDGSRHCTCAAGDLRPDLSDPATLGCVTHLAREAWASQGRLSITLDDADMWCIRIDSDTPRPESYRIGRHMTEAGALVSAIEAADGIAP